MIMGSEISIAKFSALHINFPVPNVESHGI